MLYWPSLAPREVFLRLAKRGVDHVDVDLDAVAERASDPSVRGGTWPALTTSAAVVGVRGGGGGSANGRSALFVSRVARGENARGPGRAFDTGRTRSRRAGNVERASAHP